LSNQPQAWYNKREQVNGDREFVVLNYDIENPIQVKNVDKKG
jgi:hypothetical protein